MAGQNIGGIELPSEGNNSQDNTNLIRILEKAQEKQLDNLITKLNETRSEKQLHSQKL